MAKKTILSIALILFGVASAFLVIYTYGMSGGKASITLVLLTGSIICIIVGSILAFSRVLDRFVGPVVEEINKDIEDDLRDIKARKITSTIWMIAIIGIAIPGFSFFVFRFHKLEAMWGPIPVVIPTLAATAVLAWFLPRSKWFRDYANYTPMWVYLIPVCGLILSLWLGLGRTENPAIIRSAPQQTISYSYNQPPAYLLFEMADLGNWGGALSLADCDSDVCGVIILVVLLVALTFVLVAGSAMIPHFWLFSGSIFLGIMALIALHDLRIRRAT